MNSHRAADKTPKGAEILEQTVIGRDWGEKPLGLLVSLIKGIDYVGVDRARAEFLPLSLRRLGYEGEKIFELAEMIIEIHQKHREALNEQQGQQANTHGK